MQFVSRWIISRVVWGFPRLDLLLLSNRRALREQWNVGCFGITPDRVKSAILQMVSRGDIVVFRRESELKDGLEREQIVPRAAIGSISQQSAQQYYVRCTAEAAAQWETECQFDWSRHCETVFDDHSVGDVKVEAVMITAGSISRLIEEVRKWPTGCGKILLASTMRWDVLEPWSPTYWKRLPCGYQLAAQSRSLESFQSEVEIEEEEEAVEMALGRVGSKEKRASVGEDNLSSE